MSFAMEYQRLSPWVRDKTLDAKIFLTPFWLNLKLGLLKKQDRSWEILSKFLMDFSSQFFDGGRREKTLKILSKNNLFQNSEMS